MSNSDLVSLNVNENIIKPIVEKKLQAEVLAALGGYEEFVGKVVLHALNIKCCTDGTISKYSSDNKHDFLEIISSKAIKDLAMEAVREFVKENSESMKQTIKEELKKKKNQNAIMRAIVDSAVESVQQWNFKCNVTMEQKSH